MYNKKGKSKTGHWADSVHAFLVSSVTRETLTYGGAGGGGGGGGGGGDEAYK